MCRDGLSMVGGLLVIEMFDEDGGYNDKVSVNTCFMKI